MNSAVGNENTIISLNTAGVCTSHEVLLAICDANESPWWLLWSGTGQGRRNNILGHRGLIAVKVAVKVAERSSDFISETTSTLPSD